MAGIPSIPKINRFLTSVSAFGQTDPAAAYIAAITAAGATVTAPQQAAISTFMSGEIAAGRWDGIKRFYFPVWGLAAPNAICMKSLTTGTFVGSIDHGAGYAKPNNSSSGMLTNSTLPNIGVTKESWHFATLIYEQYGYDGCFWGRSINADFGVVDDWIFNETSEEYVHNYAYFRVSNRTHYTDSTYPYGVLSIFGTVSAVNIKNRNASSAASVYLYSPGNPTNTVDFVNDTFSVMAVQSGGSLAFASQSKYGAFSFGNTLSDAQDTAYTLALKTLWETTTGLTLP